MFSRWLIQNQLPVISILRCLHEPLPAVICSGCHCCWSCIDDTWSVTTMIDGLLICHRGALVAWKYHGWWWSYGAVPNIICLFGKKTLVGWLHWRQITRIPIRKLHEAVCSWYYPFWLILATCGQRSEAAFHNDDVIKWKHFPRYWPFVRGIHRSPVNSPHKDQWRGALVFFFFICVWINGWVNNREAGDLRRYRAHYDVAIMPCRRCFQNEPW